MHDWIFEKLMGFPDQEESVVVQYPVPAGSTTAIWYQRGQGDQNQQDRNSWQPIACKICSKKNVALSVASAAVELTLNLTRGETGKFCKHKGGRHTAARAYTVTVESAHEIQFQAPKKDPHKGDLTTRSQISRLLNSALLCTRNEWGQSCEVLYKHTPVTCGYKGWGG
jgi:hypothetical protein